MIGKLYSLEEIDAYIDRKPSPEYDEFMKKQKNKRKEQDHENKM